MGIRRVKKFDPPLALYNLRQVVALEKMEMLRRGCLQPVTAAEWKADEKLAKKKVNSKLKPK